MHGFLVAGTSPFMKFLGTSPSMKFLAIEEKQNYSVKLKPKTYSTGDGKWRVT
jgi:hypothetical protein